MHTTRENERSTHKMALTSTDADHWIFLW